MAVTKRTRYEVLRRDNHTCRYCGAKAPDVELTVDHVVPVALGGGDEPENLVAARRDCNFGKASTQPDQALVADVEEDALRWARAWRLASDEAVLAMGDRNSYVEQFVKVWGEYDAELRHLPPGFDQRVFQWHSSGVPVALVTDAVLTAMSTQYIPFAKTFAYTVGIVKNQISAIEQRARELVGAEKDASDGS